MKDILIAGSQHAVLSDFTDSGAVRSDSKGEGGLEWSILF